MTCSGGWMPPRPEAPSRGPRNPRRKQPARACALAETACSLGPHGGSQRMNRLRLHALARGAGVLGLMAPAFAPAAHAESPGEYPGLCATGSFLCPDVNDPLDTFGHYVGH